MSKEYLEALKRIRQETCPATYNQDFDKHKCCDIIEQALITKSKKELAFDIIKAKKVYIRDILECENAHEYNLECAYEEDWLDEEEFELLKEVFA